MGAVREALHKAVAGEHLNEEEARQAVEEILEGEAESAAIAGLLTALRIKGETTDEIVGFARAVRAHASKVGCRTARPDQLVDNCGTGGDGLNTFNISTASAFMAAGAGALVAKHGNRSISSRCGSADVLEAAGANIQLTAEQAAAAIDEVGVGFLFAPLLHPAMKHAQPVRKALKMRTIFNLLGPLTNPAEAGAQVVGVFEPRLVPMMAEALMRLGVRRAIVAHGADGLDEITTTAETQIARLSDGRIEMGTLRPEDFGVEPARLEDLAGGDLEENALTLRRILDGEHGPRRDAAVVNAAAALTVCERAGGFREAARRAEEAVDSGAAREKFQRFVEFTNDFRVD